MATPMVRMENIHLAFDERLIFSDLSLEIKQGEKVIVNGPSGQGKSSLVKMMMGFVRPERGKVFIDSQRLTPVNRVECRFHGSIPCGYSGHRAYLPGCV